LIARPFPLVAATVLCPVLVVGQQASFTTGGGVGRVDQFTAGPVGTLAADASARLGPLAFALAGSTVDHRNLGTASLVRGDLRLAQAANGWRVGAGPLLELGNRINEEWSDAWSGAVMVGRSMGALDLQVDLAEGIAHPQRQQVSFGRRGARAMLTVGPLQIGSAVDVTIVRDSVLRDDVFFDPDAPETGSQSPFRRRVREVMDASATVGAEFERVSLSATAGRRSGDDIATHFWWHLQAAVPVAEAASVILTAARVPADVVLGIPGSRVTTVGLKVALPDGRESEAIPARVEVTRESAEMVRVVFILPGGSRAQLMGEMTGWQPVELTPLGRGRFEAWFLVGAGTYRINVALDNGPWIAPPGMPRVEDGFGGLVGLLDL
jgi:hypothetical protein